VSKKKVLLVSGGLDSTTLAYWLRRKHFDVIPVFVDYGQHTATTERASAGRLIPKGFRRSIVVVDLRDIYKGCRSRMLSEPDLWKEAVRDDDLYVPFRNQLLLTAGAAIAVSSGCDAVYSGFIQSNLAAGDCSTEFLTALARLTFTFGGIRLLYPFKDMSKSEVARLGLKIGAPIAETYSCLMRSETACGACPNCIDRAAALASLSK
jgi:7-cyano-7-deazaguanine synthase